MVALEQITPRLSPAPLLPCSLSLRKPQKSRALILCLIVPLLSACGPDNGEIGDYRYRTDMHVQPSFKKLEDPRPPVDGTVPVRGFEPAILDSVGASRLVNPVRTSSTNADSGRSLYETHCSPCHGLGAKGDGPVAAKFQVPPDLTGLKYRRAPDGYIYYVIRNGRLVMPPYAESVKSRERWLIVNYLRALQQ